MGSSTIMVIFLGPPAGEEVQRRIQTEQTGLERGERPNYPWHLPGRSGNINSQEGTPGLKEGWLGQEATRPMLRPFCTGFSSSLFPCRLPWFLESTQIQEWSQEGWEFRSVELLLSRNKALGSIKTNTGMWGAGKFCMLKDHCPHVRQTPGLQ